LNIEFFLLQAQIKTQSQFALLHWKTGLHVVVYSINSALHQKMLEDM